MHALGGAASLWLLELLPNNTSGNVASMGVVAMVAALGALLPDLDTADYKASHLSLGGFVPLVLPTLALHRLLGQRRCLGRLYFQPGDVWGEVKNCRPSGKSGNDNRAWF